MSPNCLLCSNRLQYTEVSDTGLLFEANCHSFGLKTETIETSLQPYGTTTLSSLVRVPLQSHAWANLIGSSPVSCCTFTCNPNLTFRRIQDMWTSMWLFAVILVWRLNCAIFWRLIRFWRHNEKVCQQVWCRTFGYQKIWQLQNTFESDIVIILCSL